MSLRFVFNLDLLEDPGPVKKYRLPYYLGIYRIILAVCQCYSVSLIEGDELHPFLPQVRTILMIYLVAEVAFVMKRLTDTTAPQREEDLSNDVWRGAAVIAIRFLVHITISLAFYMLDIKQWFYVLVFVLIWFVDMVLEALRYLSYSDQFEMRKMEGTRFRERRSHRFALAIDHWEISKKFLLIRMAVGVFYLAAMFFEYKDDLPYDFFPRLFWSLCFIADYCNFIYRIYYGRPQNVYELRVFENEINHVFMTRYVFVVAPVMYFVLTDNRFGPYMQAYYACLQMDNQILKSRIRYCKRLYGVELNDDDND